MPLKHDGIKYPRMTEILSDCTDKSGPLTQWSANMVVEWIREHCKSNTYTDTKPYYNLNDEQLDEARFNFREVSQQALDIGSAVHDAIEVWLKTDKEPTIVCEQTLAAFVAFIEFADEHKLKPIELEYRLWMKDWCGMLDFYGEFDGSLYVLDWKSSKGFYRDMRIQVAGYRKAMEDCGFLVHGHGVVRLDKETGYPEFKDYSKFYEQDWQEFEMCKELYLHRHPRIRKQLNIPF